VSRQCHAPLQFHELRLGDDQHVAQVAQSGDIFGAVMQGREGEGDLPLAQMLEKLRDQLVSEGLSYLGSSELLLADRTGEKSQRLGQRPAHSRHLWPLLKPQLFQVDEVVPAVGVQHPVTDDLPHRDIQVLFEEGDEGEGLRVETFIREHDLDKGETIVLGLPHLELPLAEAPPHEALLVVDLERPTVLLFGEVEEANHRGLLAAPPDEALGDLVGLQVDHLLVFVATESEHAVVHAPSLLHGLLLYQGARQDLLQRVVLSQTAKKGLELPVPPSQPRQPLLPLPLHLPVERRFQNPAREGHLAHGLVALEDSPYAIVLGASESGGDVEGKRVPIGQNLLQFVEKIERVAEGGTAAGVFDDRLDHLLPLAKF